MSIGENVDLLVVCRSAEASDIKPVLFLFDNWVAEAQTHGLVRPNHSDLEAKVRPLFSDS